MRDYLAMVLVGCVVWAPLTWAIRDGVISANTRAWQHTLSLIPALSGRYLVPAVPPPSIYPAGLVYPKAITAPPNGGP